MACLEIWVFLYVMTSACVAYKLAYLIRQSAALPAMTARVSRIVALIAGTFIVIRMIEVAEGKVAVKPFDVAMQFLWCVVLYFVINLIGRRKSVW